MLRIIPSLDRPSHILHCNILANNISNCNILTNNMRNILYCNILTQSVSNKVAQVGMIIIILELIKIYCFQNNGWETKRGGSGSLLFFPPLRISHLLLLFTFTILILILLCNLALSQLCFVVTFFYFCIEQSKLRSDIINLDSWYIFQCIMPIAWEIFMHPWGGSLQMWITEIGRSFWVPS